MRKKFYLKALFVSAFFIASAVLPPHEPLTSISSANSPATVVYVIDDDSLVSNQRGFAIHQSRIMSAEHGRNGIILQTRSGVRLNISSDDSQHYWDSFDINQYLNQMVEMRGWFYHRKNIPELRISHPSMMVSLDES